MDRRRTFKRTNRKQTAHAAAIAQEAAAAGEEQEKLERAQEKFECATKNLDKERAALQEGRGRAGRTGMEDVEAQSMYACKGATDVMVTLQAVAADAGRTGMDAFARADDAAAKNLEKQDELIDVLWHVNQRDKLMDELWRVKKALAWIKSQKISSLHEQTAVLAVEAGLARLEDKVARLNERIADSGSSAGASSASERRHCARPGCSNDGLNHCGACKSVEYCSRACQKLDWVAHKAACKATSKTKESRNLL